MQQPKKQFVLYSYVLGLVAASMAFFMKCLIWRKELESFKNTNEGVPLATALVYRTSAFGREAQNLLLRVLICQTVWTTNVRFQAQLPASRTTDMSRE